MREEIELLKTIDVYIKGRLTESEIDELWVSFLKNPEYLDWLIIETHAQKYFINMK